MADYYVLLLEAKSDLKSLGRTSGVDRAKERGRKQKDIDFLRKKGQASRSLKNMQRKATGPLVYQKAPAPKSYCAGRLVLFVLVLDLGPS